MPSSFPTSFDTFSTKVDGVDDVLAAHVNNLQDSVAGLQQNVGLTAKGSLASLSARLAVSLAADGTLNAGALTALPAESVTTALLADGAVTTPKIAALAVTTAKIGLNAVGTAQLGTSAVQTTNIGALQVTNAKIASLDAAKLTGTVDTARLGSGAADNTVFLRGDQTWATPTGVAPAGHAASHADGGTDEVSLDASQITSGTMATARLGSGSATATTFLAGDSSYKAVPYSSLSGTPSTFAAAAHASSHADGGSDEVSLDASQITSGTVATARLGSGSATSSTFLHGDSTWAALVAGDIPSLDAAKITSGTMATARLGSGSATSSTFLHGDSTWAALVAGDIPSLDAAKITSGTMATARLGSGSATSSTFLHGDSTWAALVAGDIPSLDAAKITSGTMATARLGSGAASATTFLRGDQTWAAPTKGAGLVLCAAFTPAGTGADTAEVVVPYDPADGTTSVTWNVRRIWLRVNVAGGAPVAVVEKSTAAGAFSASTVGTLTMPSGDYEVAVTSSLGTVASGNKLRFNVSTLATATGWAIGIELGV